MSSILSAEYLQNEEAAYEFIEARLWPSGAVCPHCGVVGGAGKLEGKSTRMGVWKCYACRKPFTVKVGTIFESSHIKLHIWLQAIFLIASSKKGISSHQLHRTLGISLRSAWFMSHRIREAMRSGEFEPPFGSNGGVVEVDETYIGRDHAKTKRRGGDHKFKVLSLIDRDSGRSRSLVMDRVRAVDLEPIIQANVAREAILMTDEAPQHKSIGKGFSEHRSVNHRADEYVNPAQPWIHTNTVEGFFSVFKRGMKGVYQHCGHNHLNRYLAEFDFRYSNRKALGIEDHERAERLLAGVVGRRLTYQTTH